MHRNSKKKLRGSMKNSMDSKEKTYEAPEVKVYGSIHALTGGGACGGSLDDSFPVGTPYGDLTCS
jgi:hypothetical protein